MKNIEKRRSPKASPLCIIYQPLQKIWFTAKHRAFIVMLVNEVMYF